ncbi:MFS transporter [Comamonas sp. 17RB]|uniref:MFS transporter n=1 Tax=Comamonas sp. 17RB TaxID=3047025 RepID=UPI0024B7A0A0|nr:MFS transporter [Comamonas sp. 17RB]MDI9854030.1 MFS transporter [Comamonas sp. 17RB]
MPRTNHPETFSRPGWATAAVCLASAAMPMTFTGPAVALRDIEAHLGGSPLALAWVTNAFMLAFGSCLMAAGALADKHGRRKVFLGAIAVFVAASLALMASPNLWVFDGLRALQGIASAGVLAAGAAALAQEVQGQARVRAFSLLGTSFGAGLTLGPVAAGWLTTAFGWQAIFVLVIATASIAFSIGMRVLRESRDPAAQKLDVPGALAITSALTLFTFAILQAPAQGWLHPMTISALCGTALLLAAFVFVERRHPRPLLDLSLFRYSRFVGVQLLAAAPAFGFVVLLVLLPIRFIGIEGVPVAQAGLWMAALSAPLVVLPAVAGRLSHWISPATLCAAGLLVAAGGLVSLSVSAGGAAALWPMLAIGVGISLPWGLMDGLAVSVVPTERAGMATGIFSTVRVAGEGLALAMVGALLTALIAHELLAATHLPSHTAVAVAQVLVSGNLAGAQAGWPSIGAAELMRAFEAAFSTLLMVLAGGTGLIALFVFRFLRTPNVPSATNCLGESA